MRILVVDSNLMFAKKVGRFLEANVKDACVEYAINVPILKSRLEKCKYDFVIADLLSAFDSEAMSDTLKDVEVPVVIWSVLQARQDLYTTFKTKLRTRIIPKPCTERDMRETVSSMASLVPATVETQ